MTTLKYVHNDDILNFATGQDPEFLLEILELTSEEIVEMFEDKILDKKDLFIEIMRELKMEI